jgi:hypothetical protein
VAVARFSGSLNLRLAGLAPLLLLWLATTSFILFARGDAESLLFAMVGPGVKPDRFEHINRGLGPFWVAQTSLCSVAVLAAIRRRGDIILTFLSGPCIALAICAFGQQWSDPNWSEVVSVCTIGWLVATLVAIGYWVAIPRAASARLDGAEKTDPARTY